MNKKAPFERFISKKKGSVIKEEFRQDKRAARKEREEETKKRREENREKMGKILRNPTPAEGKNTGRSFNRPASSGFAAKKNAPSQKDSRRKDDKHTPSMGMDKRTRTASSGFAANKNAPSQKDSRRKEDKHTSSMDMDKKTRPAKPVLKTGISKKPFSDKAPAPEKTLKLRRDKDALEGKGEKPIKKSVEKNGITKPVTKTGEASMPLNKYIAHGGICSRRDAAELVKEGKVTVNGVVVTEPGMKLTGEETVMVKGKKVVPSRHFVYILLNKPKDYITTSEDPQGRKTVMQLIAQATDERVYPIGRLDRNTSGVLLFTNDGDLAQTLAHPKFGVKKVYHVGLDKPLTKHDFDTILAGVQLEDGLTSVDVLAYTDPRDKTQVGIEIHSGKNRIVRRIFEHLKYDVKTLDRVMYAGLTKKDVPRGTWRYLSEKEIRLLKYFNGAANAKK